MIGDKQALLDEIVRKMTALSQVVKTLREENSQLKTELALSVNAYNQLLTQHNILIEKHNSACINAAFDSDDDQRRRLKEELDRMMREIDDCVRLLSE